MRALAPVDISVAARALLCFPGAARELAIARMVKEAEAADRYRKRLGRGHPLWGNGTLEAAARNRPLATPKSLSDCDYLSCLALVLDALLTHRHINHRRA
ncbi:MAG: hypothetical protein OEM24_01180 [Paracoccaceae bacterium]|nr:hypothetical protein [Paracoccaceae bacterium]